MKPENGLLQIQVIDNLDTAAAIHGILAGAFSKFRHLYTDEAYRSTVVSEETITRRIPDKDITVLLAFYGEQPAGTVSFKINEAGDMYFFSMGVHPDYAGKGIGHAMLYKLQQMAFQHGCKRIHLETYEPLKSAIHLYEKNGYVRTGYTRDYGGIDIFELEKILE